MRLLRISLCLFLMIGLSGSAWAQYGLCGSPDAVNLAPQTQPMQQPAQQQAQQPYNSYPASYTAPTNSAPAIYSQQVAPYSAPSGYVAPQSQYPASANYYGPQPTGYSQQPTSYAQQPTSYAQQPTSYAQQPTSTSQLPPAYAQQPRTAQTATAAPASGPVYRTASVQRPTYVAQQPAPAMPEPIAQGYNEPMPQQAPGLTNQMLNEPHQSGLGGYSTYTPNGSSSSSCRTTVGQYEEAGCGTELDCGYSSCPWYASVSGLVMTRNNSNKLWTTSEPYPYEYFQLMNSTQAQTNWKAGGEVRFGRRFCCDSCDPCGGNASAGYWALEANYWTVDPFDGYANVYPQGVPTTLSSVQAAGFLLFQAPYVPGGNAQGDYWFNNAGEQRIWRHDEVHNVEISFVRGQWASANGSNWDFAFSAGPRFFRFDEDLKFGSVRTGHHFGDSNGDWEAYFEDRITNNLWGGQLGVDLGYNFAGGALRFYLTPKVGLYDNNITNNYKVYLGNGTIPTISYPNNPAYPTQPGTVPVNSTTNTLAVISQLDVGAEWFFTQRWSLKVGYRLMVVSGIGLSDNQIPPYLNDVEAIADIDTNGELFLHGGVATLTFNF